MTPAETDALFGLDPLGLELDALGRDLPEGSLTVPIRVSVGLLREMAQRRPSLLPRHIQLVRLGQPDAEGYYNPELRAVYD